MLQRIAVLIALLSVGCQTTSGQPDLVVGELTPHSFGKWISTGTAFDNGPATGPLLAKLQIENAASPVVISSEIRGDQPTGTLLSPPFTVDRDYLAFRIAGGDEEYLTCLSLLIDGKIVRTATGRRSDKLAAASWDVRPYRGKLAQLLVTDEATGDWGHVNVSDIAQTDTPEALPVVTAPVYTETLRPQFHFTARQWGMDRLNPGQRQEGWINDLNGLIYYEGEYHLFAQRWAKCWLHAVSKDLVHWTELPPAFWEESLGSGVQSGTCVIDYDNTSGLSHDKSTPPMVAFWTRFDNRSQSICYSLDRGRTWQHYAGNPIFSAPERDPKVFWYAPGKHWVMIYYGEDKYHIRTSPDLLNWKDENHSIPNSFECPDFFELPLDGDPAKKQWVLIQGNGNYSLGTFNGKEFKEQTGRLPCDVGPNFYATQSWHNTDTGDGRRVQVAWMRDANFPEMPFSQEISFPCQLTLRTTPAGPRIFRQPIKEVALLHDVEKTFGDRTLAAGETLSVADSGNQFHLKADVLVSEGAKLIIDVGGVPITLTHNALESGHKPAAVQGNVRNIEILVDRGSIEVFVNDGELSSTRYALPTTKGITFRAENGSASVRSAKLYSMKSALPPNAK